MTNKTSIEWCDRTLNFAIGCTRVSPACDHCYAHELAHIRENNPLLTERVREAFRNFDSHVTLFPERIEELKRLRKPCTIFINSMSDTFHEKVPAVLIKMFLSVAESLPKHTFFLLTKRTKRAKLFFMDYGSPPPNVWIGTTIENRETLEERIFHMSVIKARQFISIEPMLEGFSINSLLGVRAVGSKKLKTRTSLVDWVILGGETGNDARPMCKAWVRDIRDQCAAAGVPFFFKGWGQYAPAIPGLHYEKSKRQLWQLEETGEEVDMSKVVQWKWSQGSASVRVGKAKSGFLLDGKIHREFPDFKES